MRTELRRLLGSLSSLRFVVADREDTSGPRPNAIKIQRPPEPERALDDADKGILGVNLSPQAVWLQRNISNDVEFAPAAVNARVSVQSRSSQQQTGGMRDIQVLDLD